MFKFIKGHMDSIAGVEIYPILSLLIFFIFFVLLFWWVSTAGKEYIQTMGEIPLDTEKDETL